MGKYSDMLNEGAQPKPGKYSAMAAAPAPTKQQPSVAETFTTTFKPFGVDTGLEMPGWLSRNLAGAGKSFVDTGTGIRQLMATGAADDELERQVAEQRRYDAPLMDTPAGMVGNVLGNVAQMVGPGLALRGTAVSRALLAPKTYGTAAGVGAAYGLTQPSESNLEAAGNVALGAAAGAGGKYIGDKLAGIVPKAAPVLTPARVQADESLKAAGIDVGQLSRDVQDALYKAVESGELPQVAIERIARAQSLPVPVELTKGAALRGTEHGFGAEQAESGLRLMSGKAGDLMRQHDARINQQLLDNFAELEKAQKSRIAGVQATGDTVREATTKAAELARNRAVSFLTGGKDKGASEIIDPEPIIGKVIEKMDAILANNAPDAGTALQFLKRNKLVTVGEDGVIEPTGNMMTARQAMELYHSMNKANRAGEVYDIKQGIRDALEGTEGGEDFRTGVRLFREYMQKYENPRAMDSILATFGQSTDPRVASEKLFDIMMALSQKELGDFSKTLLTGDKAARADAVTAMRAMRGTLVDRLRNAAMVGNSDTEIAGSNLRKEIMRIGGAKDLNEGFAKIETILGKRDTDTLRKLEQTLYDAKYRGSPAHKTPGTAERLLSFLSRLPIAGWAPAAAGKGIEIKAERAAVEAAKKATDVLPKPRNVVNSHKNKAEQVYVPKYENNIPLGLTLKGGSQRGAVNAFESGADKMERALSKMGFSTNRESSRISKSEYLYARTPDFKMNDNGDVISGRQFKIRVSDHTLPDYYERPDFDVSVNGGKRHDTTGGWEDVIKDISEKTGIQPVGVYKRAVQNAENAKLLQDRYKQEEMERAISLRNNVNKEWANLAEWSKSIPADARIVVSKSSKMMRAILPDGTTIDYGIKPHGMMNGEFTMDDLSRFIRDKIR